MFPQAFSKMLYVLLFHRMASASVFGVTGVLGCLFYTDWKAVIQYVPWYGAKYDHEVPK